MGFGFLKITNEHRGGTIVHKIPAVLKEERGPMVERVGAPVREFGLKNRISASKSFLGKHSN